MSDLSRKSIEAMIYEIRGMRVMLDSDLADLYGVSTKRLNEQVKRNLERFPDDFLIVPNSQELEELRSQFATTNTANTWNYKRRTIPNLFTENGVAMLSSVLTSQRAIQVNIAIMRTFTKLRSFLAMEHSLEGKVDKLEKGTYKLFKIVFERLDSLDEIIRPKLDPKRKKIGLSTD